VRLRFVAVALALTLPAAASSQSDTLAVGSRIRVSIAAPSGSPNVFIGNLERIDGDSLILGIPAGKGSIHLSRIAVGDIAVSDGRESRLRNAVRHSWIMLPGFISLATVPTTSHKTPHWAALRNTRYMLMASLAVPLFIPTPPERWRRDLSWMRR
jgi:hypothetical protein